MKGSSDGGMIVSAADCRLLSVNVSKTVIIGGLGRKDYPRGHLQFRKSYYFIGSSGILVSAWNSIWLPFADTRTSDRRGDTESFGYDSEKFR
jgi:hypothetical protein